MKVLYAIGYNVMLLTLVSVLNCIPVLFLIFITVALICILFSCFYV